MQSLSNFYSHEQLFTLITDLKVNSEIDYLGSNFIYLKELIEIFPEIEDFSVYYDVVEFCTALKPYVLTFLLQKGFKTATFLDPDIEVFSKLDSGVEIAESVGIAITPHRLTPAQPKSSYFNEIDFLQYGVFNLGYITVSPLAHQMLDWWRERMQWFATRHLGSHIFTDQKWANLIPCYFDFGVVRNKGYNVATWNIDERDLYLNKDGILYCGEDELAFIHFSQISGQLSKGQVRKYWKRLSLVCDYFEEIQLIDSLTEDYSRKLSANSLQVPSSQIDLELHFLSRQTSSRFRRRYISNSLSGKHEVFSPSFSRILLSHLVKKMERSNAMRSLGDGLKLDFIALIKRLKKPD
jgi:hypothetical protein